MTNRYGLYSPFVAVLLGLLAACRSTPRSEPAARATPDTIVIAVVNDDPLTLQDAMDAFLTAHGGHEVLVQGEGAVRELAGRLVERQLFYREAESLGIPTDEDLVAAVDEYRNEVAEGVFWRLEVDEKIDVSDEEVETFYAKTDVALAIHVIETEEREAAEELLRRVAAGEDFAELASAESIHASRSFGGSLPYVRRGELEQSLEEALFALDEPGSLTAVVQTDKGWAFGRLDERSTNPNRPPRERAIPMIRNILEDRHEDELRARVEERLQAMGELEIDETLLTPDALLGEEGSGTVVASAAGETVTLGRIREDVDPRMIRALPEAELRTALVGMLETWGTKQAVRRAAEESGLLEHPEVVEKTEKFRHDAVLKTLYRDYVYADVEITEEAARAYYDAHLEDGFTRPAEVQLAYIVLETEEKAAELLARIEAGENLERLAREHSIDPAFAEKGGRIGWVRPGTLLPEVEDVAFKLDAGEIGGPVPTDVGYFLLKALDRKDAELVPFDVGRKAAIRGAAKELQREAYAAWAMRLRERAQIEFRQEEILEAVAWLEEEAAVRAEQSAEDEQMAGPHPGPMGGGH